MQKILLIVLAMALIPASAFAVDGVVLITQSSVLAAGGFPFVISQPGSYKLGGNLSAPARSNGIIIAASNVTLDLNGFTLSGVPQTSCGLCPDVFDGISATAGLKAVTIRNGVVSGFDRQVELVNVTQGLAEELIAVTTGGVVGGIGFAQFGNFSVVRRVTTGPLGQIVLGCPSVAVENVSGAYLQQGSKTCVFANNVGSIF